MLAKRTEYAIRALVYIAMQNNTDVRPGVKEIVKEVSTPAAFMAKVLQKLVHFNFVSSAKGRGGGFFFNNPQKDLLLYDIILKLEGEDFFTKCGFGFDDCDKDNQCPMHDKFYKVREEFFFLVKNESIQSFAKKVMDGDATIKR